VIHTVNALKSYTNADDGLHMAVFQTMMQLVRDRSTETDREVVPEAGFTLIELMVVLLIIAILLAIAIPTFLGVTNTAGDRAAQSNLTNALTEAKALYEVNESYSTSGASYTSGQFASQAPEFTWTTGNCTTQSNCVSFAVFSVGSTNDGQGLALAVWSAKTSTCWYAWDVETTPNTTVLSPGSFPNAGTWYGKQTGLTSSTCHALTPSSDSAIRGFSTTNGLSYASAAAVS
jgi:type IV pilus assembly protein PilA